MALPSVSSSISHLRPSSSPSLSPRSPLLSPNHALSLLDFVAFYGRSSRTRRKSSLSYSSSSFPNRSFPHFPSTKSSSSIKALLDLPLPASSSQPLPKVANLDDIISERGACGVGFVANLDNKASHKIIQDALTALGCMEHRGGCGADNDSGDGSGVMTSIPWDLFDNWASGQGIPSFDKLHAGVGMVFLPKDDGHNKEAKEGACSVIIDLVEPD